MSARALAAALVVAAALAGCAEPVDEDEVAGGVSVPKSERWERLARDLGGPEDPASPNICNSGAPGCIGEVVREMRRRLAVLEAACDHRAPFAFMYLRVTEGVGDEGRKIFREQPYLDHLDAVFAKLYFTAFDDFAAGERDRVPQAWRIAFEAAERREVNGLGDMLLGMNAHISRDLPFALAGIGLETASGRSGKPDYDRVNGLLGDVQEPMLAEASARFDPSIERFSVSAFDFDSSDVASLLAAWRSEAYRNAEALIEADGPVERASVAQRIELNAESRARLLLTATSYALLGETTDARDAHCAARRGSGSGA